MELDGRLSKVEKQKRDLALAQILTSADNRCEAMIWQVRCS